jgi:hypothetical protein
VNLWDDAKKIWRRRIDWCLRFGDVIDVLAAIPDVILPSEIGAAHIRWKLVGAEASVTITRHASPTIMFTIEPDAPARGRVRWDVTSPEMLAVAAREFAVALQRQVDLAKGRSKP